MLDPGRVTQICSDVPENLKLFGCNNAVIVNYQGHHLIFGLTHLFNHQQWQKRISGKA